MGSINQVSRFIEIERQQDQISVKYLSSHGASYPQRFRSFYYGSLCILYIQFSAEGIVLNKM